MAEIIFELCMFTELRKIIGQNLSFLLPQTSAMMQTAAKISPTNFRVTSVLGTKREGDETARGRNDLGRNGKGTKRP